MRRMHKRIGTGLLYGRLVTAGLSSLLFTSFAHYFISICFSNGSETGGKHLVAVLQHSTRNSHPKVMSSQQLFIHLLGQHWQARLCQER